MLSDDILFKEVLQIYYFFRYLFANALKFIGKCLFGLDVKQTLIVFKDDLIEETF